MEPMDLDYHCLYRSRSVPSPSASPPISSHDNDDVWSDISDMDVDPNSPTPIPQRNGKFDNIASPVSLDYDSIGDILSLKSCADESSLSRKVNVNNLFSRLCQSTPEDRGKTFERVADSQVSQPDQLERPKSFSAVSSPFNQKTKAGYGLNDDDDAFFSHYPNSISKLGTSKTKVRSRAVKTDTETFLRSNREGQNSDVLNSKQNREMNRGPHTGGRKLVKFVCILVSVCVVIGLLQLMIMSAPCQNRYLFEKRVLEVDLRSELFGQHIASTLLRKHLKKYFEDYSYSNSKETPIIVNGRSPCRPLVLSFHGWTGVGKNFASRIVSQSFTNVNIHPLIIPLLFPHTGRQELYGEQIYDWILSNVTQCSVNLFVLDEMDKSFPAVQRGLLKAIDSLVVSCWTSAPIIFLLISNTNAVAINRVFVNRYNRPTQTRLDIKEEDFYSVFNNSGREWYSDISTAGFIDAFIPFLPLEKIHVIECIKRDLISKHLSTGNEVIAKILQELSFSTYGDLVMSTTGCKRVADKVNYVIYNDMQ